VPRSRIVYNTEKGESCDIKGTTLAGVFEIRLLRPAREEVTEGWRKLHNNVSSFVTLKKKGETEGVGGTYGGEERRIRSFEGET
jgi:hypothetical protein